MTGSYRRNFIARFVIFFLENSAEKSLSHVLEDGTHGYSVSNPYGWPAKENDPHSSKRISRFSVLA
jgi:transcription initiation factor IIF auxiliary subunit